MELLIAIALLCQATGTGDWSKESPKEAHERQKTCVKETYKCYREKTVNHQLLSVSDEFLLECIK